MSQDTNDTNEANQYRTSRTQEQIDRLDRVQDALAPYFNRLRPGESQWRAVRDAILDGKIDVPNNDAPVGAMAESQAQMASAWNAVFHVIRDVNGGSFPVRHDTKGNELTARDTAVEYIRELAKKAAKFDELDAFNNRVIGQNVPASTSPSENTVTPSGVDAALIELSAVDLAFNEAIDTISAGHEPDVLSLCTAQSRVNSVRVMLHDLKRGTAGSPSVVRIVNTVKVSGGLDEDKARECLCEHIADALDRSRRPARGTRQQWDNDLIRDIEQRFGNAPPHHFDGALGSTTFGDDNTAVIPPDGLWTWNLGHGVIAEATFVDHEGHICVVLHEADEQVTPGDRVARKPNSPGVMLRFKDSGAAVRFASRILSKA